LLAHKNQVNNLPLQQWSLVCAAIEITVELLTISVYAIVFYRYYTRKQLQKAMESRDQARSDLYLAHLRLQSAPSSPGFLTRQASFRAQQVQVQPQTVVVGQDAYVNPFMTPALFTGQPLLGGFGRVVEEEEEKEADSKEIVQDTRVRATPGPTTTYAAPQAKPFVLAAAPKKGKRSAQQSLQTSSVTSPSHFSPGPQLGPTYKDNRPFSFSPPATATASTPARLPTQATFVPFRESVVAGPSAAETSRPVSIAWPHSPSVMPAAPGELAFEHVPIPGAYGTSSPLPSPGLYGPETVMGGMFV